MSTFTVPVEIRATEDGVVERLEAWVDTGSLYSGMPAEMLERIGVRPHGTRKFTLANGEVVDQQVGRIWITVDENTEVSIAVFGKPGSQALLGAYALEGLALAADPVNERLVPVERINAFGATQPDNKLARQVEED